MFVRAVCAHDNVTDLSREEQMDGDPGRIKPSAMTDSGPEASNQTKRADEHPEICLHQVGERVHGGVAFRHAA